MIDRAHAVSRSDVRHEREVLPDIHRIPLSIVNAFLFGEARSADRFWVLIDAGLATSTHAIRRAAADRYGSNLRPAAIILTHGHFDHVGAIPELAYEWDVPVYAHPLEIPYPAVCHDILEFFARVLAT